MPTQLSSDSIPNISLNQLVKEINQSKLLAEQLENYRLLIHPKHQFQVDSIIPILSLRISTIADSFGNTDQFNNECLKSIKALSKQSKSIHGQVHAVFNQINTADYAEELQVNSSQLCENFDAVDFTIQRMLLVFMDETFEEYSTDLDSLTKKYKKLNEMLEEDENTNSWIIKQVRADQKELKAYSKEIELSPIKKSTLSTYQNTIPVIEGVYTFRALVMKKKANNPLISQNLVVEVDQLATDAQSLANDFNQWINLLYQYDQQIQVVKDHIKCFNQIADLLESQA